MKKSIGTLLTVLLLLTCVLADISPVAAASKEDESRAIAIVFDNSGSMYNSGDQAWCRATYAMEVFASMLNVGDVLQIYPMWPITVGNKTYSMEAPLQITDSTQASMIRDIFTGDARGTPIESIDCAISGLQSVPIDKKYLIVLTDGGTFSKNGSELSETQTNNELDKRIQAQAGSGMAVMYLGIGSEACMPNTEESEYFVKSQAVNTADVLSALTVMCNQVFGRDTLPKSHISGTGIDFDISMSKLIVFVQGNNIANLKVSGASIGPQIGSQQTKYSTLGAGNYKSVPDASLQGMMVTYADCPAGTYDIEYSGTAASVEVYYEPDADLDFVFTDAEGNTVDPNALYEGDYKVSFGMKDAKTGKLISSDLLGNPNYRGRYSINGQTYPIECDGFSGSVDVPLKVGETFKATLTATYLSGYTIMRDSSDFGWPEGGIQVAPRPAGDLKLEITGGDAAYSLQSLEDGSPYIAKVFYQGSQLTGDALENVQLKWNPETSNAEIKKFFAGDCWELSLHYKDPAAPQNTVCGECTVPIYAFFSAQGSSEAQAQCPLSYKVNEDVSSLQVELNVPERYILIKELEDSPAIAAKLMINGAPLNAEELAAVQLQIDCSGLEYAVTPDEQESSYLIKLLPGEKAAEDDYAIRVTALYTDRIGRETQADAASAVTLSTVPLWVRWAIVFLFLVILAIAIWCILHIRKLPSYFHTARSLSSMSFDGDDVTQSTNFLAEIKKRTAKVQGQYGGKKFGVSMDVAPGKESYLYKPQKQRSAEVRASSVRKFGPAKIQEAMIGSTKYIADDTTGNLVPALPNQKPFLLTNGMMVKLSGTIQDSGVDKDFELASKLNYKKK